MDHTGHPAPARQEPQSINKWLALFIVSVGTLMTTLDGGITSVSYPALVTSFHTDASTVLWVAVAYFLTSTGLLLTLGWVGDVIGRRKMYSLGFFVFTVGIGFAALSQSVIHLILARVVQGLGASMILANGNAIVTAAFPSRERGMAMGFVGSIVGLGLGAGPVLGGVLLDALDWRALFYTRLPLGIAGTLLVLLILPKDRRRRGSFQIDYLGAVALFGSLASFLLMVNQGGKLGFGSPFVLAMAGLTVALLPVLIVSQRRAVRPIIQVALFKERQFSLALAVLTFHYLAGGAVMFLAPFYFIDSLGYSATRMGLFLTILPGMRLMFSPASGWLSDKVGYRVPTFIGMILVAAGFFMLSRQGVDAAAVSIAISLGIAGIGSAFFEPPNTSSIMGSVTGDRLGTAAASVATARQIAMSVGIALAGAIFTMREKVYLAELRAEGLAEPVAAASAIAQGFSDALVAGVILAVIGIAFSMVRAQRRERATKPEYEMPAK